MTADNIQKKIEGEIEGEDLVAEQIEKALEKKQSEQEKVPALERGIASEPSEKMAKIKSVKESELGKVTGVEVAQAQEQRYKEVEKILEDEEMKEKYKNLPPLEKKEFESAGENIARQINNLLEEARVDVPKITDLVKEWQANIPSTDEYFKQEVKNKVDKIMDLLKEQ